MGAAIDRAVRLIRHSGRLTRYHAGTTLANCDTSCPTRHRRCEGGSRVVQVVALERSSQSKRVPHQTSVVALVVAERLAFAILFLPSGSLSR